MKERLPFRAWFYFRQGYGMYFAFILAAVNTLTLTYFLAIERYPVLSEIFPTFVHYVAIISCIGVPMLVLIGYVHFKRTAARRAEIDVAYETNPYVARTLVNTQIILSLNFKITEIILKLSTDQKLTKEEIANIQKLQTELSDFITQRTLQNKMDLAFFQKIEKRASG